MKISRATFYNADSPFDTVWYKLTPSLEQGNMYHIESIVYKIPCQNKS